MEIDRNLKAIRDLTEEGVSDVHPKLIKSRADAIETLRRIPSMRTWTTHRGSKRTFAIFQVERRVSIAAARVILEFIRRKEKGKMDQGRAQSRQGPSWFHRGRTERRQGQGPSMRLLDLWTLSFRQ